MCSCLNVFMSSMKLDILILVIMSTYSQNKYCWGEQTQKTINKNLVGLIVGVCKLMMIYLNALKDRCDDEIGIMSREMWSNNITIKSFCCVYPKQLSVLLYR